MNWYSMSAEKVNGGLDIYILDEIGKWGISASQFISEITQRAEKDDELRIHINSPGGEVFDGLAIYNFLSRRGQVTTIIEGLAASMASIVAMAGSNIIMPANAFLMIHNPWGVMVGDSDELKKAAEAMDKMEDSLAMIYSKKTGIGKDEIKKMMDEETWLTGQEAVDKGFATTLVDAVDLAASYNTAKIKNLPEQIATAKAQKEKEMDEIKKLQGELQEVKSALDKAKQDAEEQSRKSFDEGVEQGSEQTLGTIKARMDRFHDASFVMETIGLSDDAVKDSYIERLERKNKETAEAISKIKIDSGETAVSSTASGNSPDEVTSDCDMNVDKLMASRVAELKGQGKSAEMAWKIAHAEYDEKGE